MSFQYRDWQEKIVKKVYSHDFTNPLWIDERHDIQAGKRTLISQLATDLIRDGKSKTIVIATRFESAQASIYNMIMRHVTDDVIEKKSSPKFIHFKNGGKIIFITDHNSLRGHYFDTIFVYEYMWEAWEKLKNIIETISPKLMIRLTRDMSMVDKWQNTVFK